MIPKKIHYCWLGGNIIPLETKVLISTWKKKMPDYEIKCWTEKNFDVQSVKWVRQAIENKKWAFAADYIRLYALYHEGGIYMDTDVEVFKPFDEFLKYSFFSSVEYHKEFETEGKPRLGDDFLPKIKGDTIPNMGILSALMACEPGNAYIKQCLDFYDNQSFVRENGSLYTDIIIPDFLAREAIPYGFRYKDETQYLKDNMVVFDSSVFAGDYICQTPDSYALHYCYGTWRDRFFQAKVRRWYYLKKWALKKIIKKWLSP